MFSSGTGGLRRIFLMCTGSVNALLARLFFLCVCVLCKQGISKLAARNQCSHVVQTYTWSVYNRVAQISALLQTEPQMNSGDKFF